MAAAGVNWRKLNCEEKQLELPLLPLRGVIVFPYLIIHLDVGREKSVSALEEAMVNNRLIVLAAQLQAKTNEPEPHDIYKLGTLAEVKQLLKLPDGTLRVLVEGLSRVQVKEFVQRDPHYRVLVEKVEEDVVKSPELEALMRTTFFQFEQYIKNSKRVQPEVLASVSSIEEPGRLADVIASHLNLKVEDKQALLEAISPRERLEKLYAILLNELEIIEMERRIHLRVRKQMEKTQKEYYLREQMKAIQKELGEKDERMAEADELRARVEEQDLPEEVRERALKEIDRLEKMPPMVAEAAVVRNYLDWLLSLPWNIYTEDHLDLERAEQILNEDHYGLDKVKERILEFLAVRKLTQNLKGPILCLVGPPGVGKTSLARSVARAMGRKFVRFSLGGVRDEAEIRGHRRTYVGAMPGKIIQSMRQVGSKNPVLLLDEIDKMSMDFRGDPSAALLEVLDPEQNNAFGDHYLEVTFDLSQVFFITTANTTYNIPRPLLDRMEIIQIAGYTEDEKMEIAKKHLLPKQLKVHGLTKEQLLLTDAALTEVIRSYTRESGVRNLERELATICRKTARQLVSNQATTVRVGKQNLHKFLGIPKFRYGLKEEGDRVGVATGLAWTEVGGDILTIEVSAIKGKGNLLLTGKLGEVMRESAQAAVSYIRSRARAFGIDENFHENIDLHIHVPEGAIPKDGPSAGITMATAVVSALSGVPVRSDVAMTGEITLRGRVLPIGGLKEKVLAAHRAGINTVIIPKENQKDMEEIPAPVARKLRFVLVEEMDAVLKEALATSAVAEDVG
ncbi:MAG TPA: endopeptidase La [Firmicutes bacterium]|uniref:Lon protease n=1 Tax=Capillibacterium thermochitinicola TaxID=2699427 RepID=A0A8J6LLH3_9FIRM|nr:endopeptidase La [Capillibacterium thermochitinicola]MBA2132409.1 endopeptidase La [Capillibacterium thermochitinicola]HHW12049.1 endopeptidase La [Bacillota bacterium]